MLPLVGLVVGLLLYAAGREKLAMVVAFVALAVFFVQYASGVAPLPFLPQIPAQGPGP